MELKYEPIPNVKVQMPNQIQSPKGMPKSKILNQVQDLVRHDQSVILNLFQNPILKFDIHLTFGF
jgi:hypothetical protein